MIGKGTVRLYPVDISRLTWQQVADGAPAGVMQKILARDPERGSITRLVKVEAGVDQGIFVHEHWEEVYVLEGSKKIGDEYHPAGTYTCKPPDIEHGPIITDEGFLSIEFRDYHRADMKKPYTRLYPMDVQRIPWVEAEEAGQAYLHKVLARDPETDSETLLLRVSAGADLPSEPDGRMVEMYLLEGSGKIGSLFYPKGSYICLPPDKELGKIDTDEGLLILMSRNAL